MLGVAKRFAGGLLLILQMGCAAAMPAQEQDMTYQAVITLPGQTKDVIYEKSRQWIASSFKSGKAVLEYENRQEGIIMGNGSMPRPASSINLTGGGTVSFSMKEEVKDGKARITFTNLMVNSAVSYSPVHGVIGGGNFPIMQADVEGVHQTFGSMAVDLEAFILQGRADNW